MNRRPTPQAFGLATLLAWSLFLGILCDRLELLVAAIPLAIGFLSANGSRPLPRFALTHTLSEERLVEGQPATVNLRLKTEGAIPAVELLSVLPRQLFLVSGTTRTLQHMEAGAEAAWSFEVRCPTRGRFDLGLTLLRFWDRSGLWVIETRLSQSVEIAVYPAIERLRHVPRPLRTHSSFGNYLSPRVGEGIEPGELRPFASGDRIRRVNWRATARRDQLYVTRFQEERNADVIVLLDTLSDCGSSPHSTLDVGVRAAAALAHAYLARKDRVGFIEFGAFLRWISPGAGRRQVEVITEALLPAATHFSYVAPRLDRVPPRILPPDALVIALSPVLDQRFVDALMDLLARRFDVIVLAISPVHATRRSLADSAIDVLACRIWTVEWHAKLDALRRRGVAVAEWDGAASLEATLAPFHHRQRTVSR